jgi:hypothetical protein
VFRIFFHDVASTAELGVSVVGLSHLSTMKAVDLLSDLLIRHLLEVLVPVADGQELERCFAASSGVRVLG